MSNAMRPNRQKAHHMYGGIMTSLARSTVGSVLPIYAIGTLVLTGLVGGGVDLARAYQAERRLQAACDSGALAGRRAVGVNGFDAAAEEQADRFFNVNFDPNVEQTSDTAFAASSDDEGGSVVGTASAKLPTVIMPIFGFDTIDLSVTCTASMGVGNSDVMFVLDTTGSMAWTPEGDETTNPQETRIFALQQAMLTFYETVEQSTSGGNSRVRYGFVPYGSAVNVGQVLSDLDADYISDTSVVQSRTPVNWGPVVETWSESGTPTNPKYGSYSEYSSTRYTTIDSCTRSKPSNDTSWRNNGSPTDTTSSEFSASRQQMITATGSHQEQYMAEYDCQYVGGNKNTRGYYIYRRYLTRSVTSYKYEARDPIPVTASGRSFQNWLYRPVEYDTSRFKTFASTGALVAVNRGATRSVNETWNGCIIERQTVPEAAFEFVSLARGITPTGALDLDIDSAPTSDPATQWKPMWTSVAFERGTVLPSLVGDNTAAWAGCPPPSQILEEMTEERFNDYVESLEAVGATYHDIGLLWGARIASPTGIFADTVNEDPDNGGAVSRHMIFMTDGELAPNIDINSSYGIESVDQRITGNGRVADQRARHRARFLALCDAVTARGIRLWVIAFGTDLNSDLQACASPDSSFQSDNASELTETFQEIARQVGELRIVQ